MSASSKLLFRGMKVPRFRNRVEKVVKRYTLITRKVASTIIYTLQIAVLLESDHHISKVSTEQELDFSALFISV